MLFNSLQFAFFLPLVFIIYWILPHRFRWIFLLVSSYYFYMCWNVKYVFLIFITTLISWVCAILVEKAKSKAHKKAYIVITSVISLGVLFVFKYFNFISDNVFIILKKMSLDLSPITLKILLPVGISFYTFQTLSYVIDVYKGKISAEKNFGYYAAFVSFFPQLVAGPIERTENLLPQIKNEHVFNYSQASYGLKLMAWGFFKKMVIADNLAIYVDKIFGDVYSYSGSILLLATFFFTIQIYCDFSGYSDIAIGVAKLMGIDLMKNFNSPYFSQSIHDFWSRWHISLSTWFRDYVYIPLGGNRCGKIKKARNLMLTFLLSGLWHGASWQYVIWGVLHGIMQLIENFLNLRKCKCEQGKSVWWIRTTLVFLLINITWIFFRMKNIHEVWYILGHMFDGINYGITYLLQLSLYIDRYTFATLILFIIMLFVFDYNQMKCDVIERISGLNFAHRWTIYIVFTLVVCLFSQKGAATQFVYFQF